VPAPPSRSPFSYLILRVVPSVERGEQLNVGVVMFCRQREFLGASVELDGARLAALGAADERELAEHLRALVRVAEGVPDGGPIAALPASERFGWLAAPSSTIVQPSDVHTGLCDDPAATLRALHARLVA
jgi:hypothetical protein